MAGGERPGKVEEAQLEARRSEAAAHEKAGSIRQKAKMLIINICMLRMLRVSWRV